MVDIRKQVENAFERSEFVTNACKYSATVANFERMSIIFIRMHIRKHIRLCVRAALRLHWLIRHFLKKIIVDLTNNFVIDLLGRLTISLHE